MTEVSLYRLERLERSNRRLRAWTVVSTIVLLVFLGLGAKPSLKGSPTVLQGPIIITDSQGSARLMLGVVNGQPAIELIDSDKQSRAVLGLDERGQGMLGFGNASGKLRVAELRQNGKVSAYLRLGADAKENEPPESPHVLLSTTEQDATLILATGKQLVLAGTSQKDGPVVNLKGVDGKQVARLPVQK